MKIPHRCGVYDEKSCNKNTLYCELSMLINKSKNCFNEINITYIHLIVCGLFFYGRLSVSVQYGQLSKPLWPEGQVTLSDIADKVVTYA